MAAPKLTYRIVNSQVVTSEVEMDVGGETATVRRVRLVVEAEPDDALGKVLTLVLSADLAGDYPEGAMIAVTVKVEGA